MKCWAFCIHHFNQCFDDHWIKTTQWRLFTDKQVGIRTQGAQYTSEFDGDVASTNDCGTLRLFLEFKETIGVDAVLGTRYVGKGWFTTDCDQDMIGGVLLAIDFDSFYISTISINKGGKAFDHFNLVVAQYVVVCSVNAFDIGFTVLYQLTPLEACHVHIEAVILSIKVYGFSNLRTMPHDFFGHTADINTGSSQCFGFNQGNLCAIHSSSIC